MYLTINYAKLDNKELLALAQAADTTVKKLTGIEAIYVLFKALLANSEVASNQTIEKALAKVESKLIKQEDNVRDNLIIGLGKIIEGMQKLTPIKIV